MTQELEVTKSPGLAPPATTDEIVSAPVPTFVTVTTKGLLVAPCAVAAKLIWFVEKVAAGTSGAGGTYPAQPAEKMTRLKAEN